MGVKISQTQTAFFNDFYFPTKSHLRPLLFSAVLDIGLITSAFFLEQLNNMSSVTF